MGAIVELTDDKVVVVLKRLAEPVPSSTGKTLIVAKSDGIYRCEDTLVDGTPVSVSATVFINPRDKRDS